MQRAITTLRPESGIMERVFTSAGLACVGLLVAACGSTPAGVSSNEVGAGGTGATSNGGAAGIAGGAAGAANGGAAGHANGGTAGAAAGGASSTSCNVQSQTCHDCWASSCAYKTCLTDSACKAALDQYKQCVCQAQQAGASTTSCADALKAAGTTAYEFWKCGLKCTTACGT